MQCAQCNLHCSFFLANANCIMGNVVCIGHFSLQQKGIQTTCIFAMLARGVEKSQNALVRGRQRCTQLSIFESSLAELLCFWCCQIQKLKKSRRIAWFWMLWSSKNEEVSQNCFVFDVVNFEKWGSPAELLRFWCCQVQNLRTSRRIVSFSSLPIDR